MQNCMRAKENSTTTMKPPGLLWERGSLCFLILALPGLLAHKRTKWLFDHRHKTSCQTGTPMTPVLEGDLSIITCHFSDDLRYWKFDFGVTRHDLNGFDPLGDLILSCTWNSGKDNPSCIGKGSERVKLAATGNVTTLEIPNTQRKHAGRYSCRYALSWPDNEGHCTLAVAGWSTFCSVPHATVAVGASSSVTCHFHSDLSQTREKFHVYRFGDDGSPPVEVGYCTWNVKDENGKPRCSVKAGYHLDADTIGTNATLQISSAKEILSGRYSCRTIPANKNVKVIDCSLNVKVLETTTKTAATTITATQTTSNDSRLPKETDSAGADVNILDGADDSQGRSASAKLQTSGLIPAVMCLLVACIMIIRLEVSFSIPRECPVKHPTVRAFGNLRGKLQLSVLRGKTGQTKLGRLQARRIKEMNSNSPKGQVTSV